MQDIIRQLEEKRRRARLGAFFNGGPERACPEFAYPGTEDAPKP